MGGVPTRMPAGSCDRAGGPESVPRAAWVTGMADNASTPAQMLSI